jgi:hypothetical protein
MKKILSLLLLMYSTATIAAVCPGLNDFSKPGAGPWQLNKPLPQAPTGATWNQLVQDTVAVDYYLLSGITVAIDDGYVYCGYGPYPDYYDMLTLSQSAPNLHYAPAPGTRFVDNECHSTNPADCAFILTN